MNDTEKCSPNREADELLDQNIQSPGRAEMKMRGEENRKECSGTSSIYMSTKNSSLDQPVILRSLLSEGRATLTLHRSLHVCGLQE